MKNKSITCLADIPDNESCVIFGAGNSGQVFFKLIGLYRKDLNVEYFIDSVKTGMVDNINILFPDDFFKLNNNQIILIASEYWYEIEKLIQDHNYTNYLKIPVRFLYSDTIDKFEEQISNINPVDNHFFPLCCNGQEGKNIKEKFKLVENLLASPEEQRLYRILTCQNLTPDECRHAIVEYYFNKKPSLQYMDYINTTEIKTMIDGGVYNGRETVYFVDGFGPDLTIYGFEPNEDILLKGDYYSKINQVDFIHVKKGLWIEDKTLFFQIDGSSSHLTEHQSGDNIIKIPVTNIDKYVKENSISKIDFIKMDIEGAELEALKGAYITIKKDRPQLAICIYHKQSDFYEIPLYLDSILDNYHYHLNHYTPSPYESVWYAIPDEKSKAS